MLKTSLIEIRRLLSLLAIPWVSIALLCIFISWYLISVVGLDALLAPVIKTWVVFKPFLLHSSKLILAFIAWLWLHTIGKFAGWIVEIVTVIFAYVGGWQAWSVKKLLRQFVSFVVSFTTRFFFISVLLNLLFGNERKGIKQVPALLATRFQRSRLNKIVVLWSNLTERQKRLFFGVVLCLILIIAGHTLLGLSILLFDLLWELAIILARFFARFWRFIWPLIARFIPNVVGNFFTKTVLPKCAEVLPVIRDDHRVMYLRFNIRRHYRNVKAYLYQKSRSKRQGVRIKIRPFVSDRVRERKSRILEAAMQKKKSDDNEPEQ